MILLLTVLFIFLILFEYRRSNIFFSFYSLFLLYGYFYTIGIYFSDEIINEKHDYATFLIILGISSFILGYNCIIIFKPKIKYNLHVPRIQYYISNSFLLLLLLSGVAISFFLYVVFFEIGFINYFFVSRAGRSLVVRPYGIFMVFIDLFNIISALSLFLYLQTSNKKYKYIFILVFLLALSHAVITISRNNLVLLLLPVIYIYHYFGYLKARVIILAIFSGLLLATLWKPVLFALIFSDLSSIDLNIKIPNEFYAWHSISQDVLDLSSSFNGSSYFDAIASLIYPFYETDNLSIWYVKRFEFDVFNIGGGRGFSNVLEAYLNFGILGVFFVFLALGFLMYLFQMKANKSIYMFFPYAFSFPFVHRIFRSDFLSLTKTWWWMYFMSFLIILVLFKPMRKNIKEKKLEK